MPERGWCSLTVGEEAGVERGWTHKLARDAKLKEFLADLPHARG
jgi:hypothetical protein